MISDIESFLCNYLQTTHFSIQLDESTLPDNAALLLTYARFIMNKEIYEELLFARTLITDTKGESIFHVLKDYFIEKAIPLSNIISVATGGAPAMDYGSITVQQRCFKYAAASSQREQNKRVVVDGTRDESDRRLVGGELNVKPNKIKVFLLGSDPVMEETYCLVI
ncbi:unnamed protein product [Acanthoscelides obtectus]|uniref:Uncharacterized protein n=1 Tax=Acanthoscelides obtectus TaxID=200917 RepID=A0A9P0MH23_ACAOB|nr:unnamed protein product [Acanthoscelides obtectus]CAK1636395.1 Protein ZBED8 [Acanthoscelides obtectus]